MWITEMRAQHEPQIMVKEVVPVIQAKFPKYDAQLHSKVERPDSYGIELCPEAEQAVRKHFGIKEEPAQKLRKRDNRSLPCRISCRLEKSEYDRLQIVIRDSGRDTMQDWLRAMVLRCLNEYDSSQNNIGGLNMENKIVISVKFKDRYTGAFAGQSYSYFCTIPVSVGDIVSVPTVNGDSVAQVCEVDVPLSKVGAHIRPLLKVITAKIESEAE